ncbi:hypothetical protein DM02DRAFT_611367 [Periconia macrospinosa]|uniref:Zn(2)-C6 fungal-type domain-containing protein n=1 Tax=Periconia macrospinosa TaxID=97972 RepID=A0A2V1E3N4_9PLEO|nr:hypothetical protein DM02DRAFT_611367 [Periconia macrospinosa]
MSSKPTETTEPVTKKPSEHALNRACEACRVSKVRCLSNPDSASNQCQRCARAGRKCIFAAPAKRRQRKRTDVRVAELEKEVKQLTSLLRPSTSKSPADAEPSDSSMDEDESISKIDEKKPSPSTQTRKSPQNQLDSWDGPPAPASLFNYNTAQPKDLLQPEERDILDRGIITRELAEELLNIYRDDQIRQCPSVTVDREWTVDDLRTKKPALFHAVMAAASHVKGSALSNRMHEEIVYYYARNVFINGEKGLQWVQAFFVTISYWTPPANHTKLQIFSYASIAASMALEIGMTSKPRTHEQLPKRAIRSLQKISSAEELQENCRTILSLYIMTAGFGIRLRRPYILIFNSWMEECLHMLSKSSNFEDRRVVAWLRLQRIADEAYTAFGFDDASTSFTLSEIRLRTILKIFEKRMQDWKGSVPADVWTPALTIEYHQNMMSMWEFAMDGGRYDAPEFRNRFLTLPALDDDSVQPETNLSRSSLQVNATIMCISCAQTVLDNMLSISPTTLQRSPGVLFARSIYAMVVLLRADYAIGTDSEGMGEFLDSDTLKVDFYLNSLLKLSEEAIGPQKCKVPSHWLFILQEKIQKWHIDHMQWRKEGKHLRRNKGNTTSTNTKDATNLANIIQTISNGSSSSNPRTVSEPSFTGVSLATRSASTTSFATPNPTVDITSPPTNTNTTTQSQTLPSVPQLPLPDFNNVNTPWSWQTPHRFLPGSNTAHFSSTGGGGNNNNNGGNNNNNAFAAAGGGADMMDFSTAFSNGDLYLWNETADTFGGWMPQTGNMFGDAQFGTGMGGQGF